MSEQDRIAFEKIEKSFCDWFDPNDGQNYQDCWYAAWSAATTESNKRIEELESELAKFGERRQLYKDKWIVYKPLDAPYAGIRTEDGVTIAGTSSGLSEKDAQEICANRVDSDSLYAMVGMLANERKKYTELQASHNLLREALLKLLITKAYKDQVGKDDAYEIMCDGAWEIADKALSTTPAESLQAFENEVIEKCAKVCDHVNNQYADIFKETKDRFHEGASYGADDCAESIRDLKGK